LCIRFCKVNPIAFLLADRQRSRAQTARQSNPGPCRTPRAFCLSVSFTKGVRRLPVTVFSPSPTKAKRLTKVPVALRQAPTKKKAQDLGPWATRRRFLFRNEKMGPASATFAHTQTKRRAYASSDGAGNSGGASACLLAGCTSRDHLFPHTHREKYLFNDTAHKLVSAVPSFAMY